MKRYYNIKEISEYTSLPIKTLYSWVGNKIPAIKIGRRVLFEIEDVDKTLKSLKCSSVQSEKIVKKIIGNIMIDEL